MRLNNILITALIAVGLFGCSSEDNIELSSNEAVKVPIVLKVGINHGLQLSSRSSDETEVTDHIPHRLVSWRGEQCVDNLRIYVFQSSTKEGPYLYYGGGECLDGGYLVPSFNNATPVSGEFEEHTFAFTPKLLVGGYYKFLAVGRDDLQGAILPDAPLGFVPWGVRSLSDLNVEIGVTEFHNATMANTLGVTQFPFNTTEVFSGIMKYEDGTGKMVEDYVFVTGKEIGFEKTIELRRAVAGLWINVTDIPAMLTDDESGSQFVPRELLVTMPLTNSVLCLNCNAKPTHYDLKKDKRVGYENFSGDIGEFANGEIFPQWRKSNDESQWLRSSFTYEGVTYGKNCAMISNYLIPVDPTALLNDDESTLTLKLCNSLAGTQVSLNVKCKIKEVIDPVTGETVAYDGDSQHYPILANCLYTIGTPEKPLSLSLIKALSRGEKPVIEMECIPLY